MSVRLQSFLHVQPLIPSLSCSSTKKEGGGELIVLALETLTAHVQHFVCGSHEISPMPFLYRVY